MAQRFNINLGFIIDTSKLDKAIREIAKRMNELQNKGTLNGLTITEQQKRNYIEQMSSLRREVNNMFARQRYGVTPLKGEEQNRYVNRIEAQVNSINANNELRTQFAASEIQNNEKLAESFKDVKKSIDPVNKAMGRLGETFKTLMQFSIAQTGFRVINNSITNTISYLKELDAAMTQIRTVTGASNNELRKYAEQYNQLGKELGRTTTEIANAAVEFYRQGRTQAETMDLLRATMVGSRISGEQTTTAAETLTSTINGFQLAATEAMSIIDKFSALDASMATSFSEMSYALTKVASSANKIITELKSFKIAGKSRMIISSL